MLLTSRVRIALAGVRRLRHRGEPARRRSLRRFCFVSSALLLMVVAALALAAAAHQRSQASYQGALDARADAGREQKAAILLWHEREAVNEYIHHPSARIMAEVDALDSAFDQTLRGGDPNPLPGERTLESSAQRANAAFIDAFAVDQTSPGETSAEIAGLDQRAGVVVEYVDALVRINLASVGGRERQASSAARTALVGMIAGGVLVLLLLGVFIIYVLRLVRDLGRQARESEHSALHDPLTDLPNRTLFHDRVEREIVRASRDQVAFSLLMFDLDRFKEINDTLGHSMGDLILCQIGPRLGGTLRPGDTLARLGGDEFAVLLPGSGDDTAEQAAGQILAALQQPFTLPIMSPRMSASIGIVTYPTHGDTAETLIQHADVALYLAKEHRNSAATYDAARDPYNPARLVLVSDLDRAVANDEFVLHYQPKVDTRTKELISVEALVRWQHPERGLLNPGEFIALAEHTGLIKQVTLLVLAKAIRQIREWQDEGQPRAVSVNLSAANLLDSELVHDVIDILEHEDVDPSWLGLEITETTIMTDPERAMGTLRELAALGISLSIDDFGTGYSSLAYLRRLPVHEIKIDRSFVQYLARSGADAKIVQSTVELAHSLGFSVVAEGVEDQPALDLLAGYGCDQVQGFYLCRPQPAAQLAKALRAMTRRHIDPAQGFLISV